MDQRRPLEYMPGVRLRQRDGGLSTAHDHHHDQHHDHSHNHNHHHNHNHTDDDHHHDPDDDHHQHHSEPAAPTAPAVEHLAAGDQRLRRSGQHVDGIGRIVER
jgi:hypothetical protein